jgi:hypothetical protein
MKSSPLLLSILFIINTCMCATNQDGWEVGVKDFTKTIKLFPIKSYSCATLNIRRSMVGNTDFIHVKVSKVKGALDDKDQFAAAWLVSQTKKPQSLLD